MLTTPCFLFILDIQPGFISKLCFEIRCDPCFILYNGIWVEMKETLPHLARENLLYETPRSLSPTTWLEIKDPGSQITRWKRPGSLSHHVE